MAPGQRPHHQRRRYKPVSCDYVDRFLLNNPGSRLLKLFEETAKAKYPAQRTCYDCLHIAICKRLNYILITQNKILIQFAKKYIIVKKKEEII